MRWKRLEGLFLHSCRSKTPRNLLRLEQTIIFPGSFDPVHNGHVSLARHVASIEMISEVWIMPSRRNPLKSHGVYASDSDRLEMLRLATNGFKDIRVSDIELSLPYPSYTYRTLQELKQRFPDRNFRLLIGSDNWLSFNKWWHAVDIIQEFGLMIYPRPGYEITIPDNLREDVILLKETPVFPYSSTQVREILAADKDTTGILDSKVKEYIYTKGLYSNANTEATCTSTFHHCNGENKV